MAEQDYLTRIDGQLNWYEAKSRKNRLCHYWFRGVIIALSASVPFLLGITGSAADFLKIVAGFLGVTIAVMSGLSELLKFQDKWILYRSAAERLKSEKEHYLQKSGPYKANPAAPSPFETFVERVESILGDEGKSWGEVAGK